MKIDRERRLFVGTKLDSKLREALASIGPGERGFVTKEDGPYLRLVDGNGDTYMGKVVDAALPLDAVEDVRRNISSIMSRICGGKSPKLHLSIFACADEVAEVVPVAAPIATAAVIDDDDLSGAIETRRSAFNPGFGGGYNDRG